MTTIGREGLEATFMLAFRIVSPSRSNILLPSPISQKMKRLHSHSLAFSLQSCRMMVSSREWNMMVVDSSQLTSSLPERSFPLQLDPCETVTLRCGRNCFDFWSAGLISMLLKETYMQLVYCAFTIICENYRCRAQREPAFQGADEEYVCTLRQCSWLGCQMSGERSMMAFQCCVYDDASIWRVWKRGMKVATFSRRSTLGQNFLRQGMMALSFLLVGVSRVIFIRTWISSSLMSIPFISIILLSPTALETHLQRLSPSWSTYKRCQYYQTDVNEFYWSVDMQFLYFAWPSTYHLFNMTHERQFYSWIRKAIHHQIPFRKEIADYKICQEVTQICSILKINQYTSIPYTEFNFFLKKIAWQDRRGKFVHGLFCKCEKLFFFKVLVSKSQKQVVLFSPSVLEMKENGNKATAQNCLLCIIGQKANILCHSSEDDPSGLLRLLDLEGEAVVQHIIVAIPIRIVNLITEHVVLHKLSIPFLPHQALDVIVPAQKVLGKGKLGDELGQCGQEGIEIRQVLALLELVEGDCDEEGALDLEVYSKGNKTASAMVQVIDVILQSIQSITCFFNQTAHNHLFEEVLLSLLGFGLTCHQIQFFEGLHFLCILLIMVMKNREKGLVVKIIVLFLLLRGSLTHLSSLGLYQDGEGFLGESWYAGCKKPEQVVLTECAINLFLGKDLQSSRHFFLHSHIGLREVAQDIPVAFLEGGGDADLLKEFVELGHQARGAQ